LSVPWLEVAESNEPSNVNIPSPVFSAWANWLPVMSTTDVPVHGISSPGTGYTQISQDVIWQLLTVKVRNGPGMPKLSVVSLLFHFPGAARQAGVGEAVMVAVAVGVLVSVGVSVRVAVSVRVGVEVFVGVGVSVGPNNCPGPQAERNETDKISGMMAI
jgi:hypothetical protein